MQLEISEFHRAAGKDALNEEWFVVENTGDKPFSTAGCTVGVAFGGNRLRALGVLDPGFVLAPGEKMRVITGNPGKKAHGKPPAEDKVKNYHLFQAEPILRGPGTSVALTLKQLEVARATFDPAAKTGVAAAKKD